MSELWRNGLFSITVYLLSAVLCGLIIGWLAKHIGSDVVKIAKNAVKENEQGGDA